MDLKYKTNSGLEVDIKEMEIISNKQSGDVKTLAKIKWGKKGKHKWNIRNFNTENKIMYKGITLNEDELDLLVESLLRLGFGDTEILSDLIKSRDKKIEKTIENFESIFEDADNSGYDIFLKGDV